MPKYAQMTADGFVHTQSENPHLDELDNIKRLPDNFSGDVCGCNYINGQYIRPAVYDQDTGELLSPEEVVLTQ